jgi:digeranylgeranylglycerophospholipid reductase
MAPEIVDVLVVGGGPAGLAAAAAAAAEGAHVLLVERRPAIGDPVHTSGATAIDTVSRWGVPRTLWHPVSRARFVSTGEEAVFEFDEPPLCVIDVRGTYRWLADRAVATGARVETGVGVAAPLLRDGGVRGAHLAGRNGGRTVEAGVVIDATGYRASVSRQAGLHPGFSRFGVGYEYELNAPACRQDEVVIVVGERYAPTGYGWAFPWGAGRVRLGVGLHHVDTRADPKVHLDALFADAASLGLDLAGAEVVEHHDGLLPAERVPKRLVADGLLAVGDAACQATLLAGEGIRISLFAGDLAGRVAARAVAVGDTRAEGLRAYERAFRSEFGRRLRLGHALNRRLAGLDDRGWDVKIRQLRRVPPAAVPLLLQSEFAGALVRSLARSPQVWLPLAKVVASAALGPERRAP